MELELKLWDSLSKSLKTINLKQKTIKIYVCGITVYDFCHLGHGRILLIFDLLHRFLKTIHPNVIFVQNITDIAEKITEKAKKEAISEQDLAQTYIDQMFQDMKSLNILFPDHQPRASAYVNQMITYIELMIAKNFAYVNDFGVFFDTTKVAYGKFEHRILDDSPNEKKRSQEDFALWKFQDQEGQIFQSPWGSGVPGWHIECTAMSMDLLGESFDIHGGGSDLKFPHHENEIAQCEALTGSNPAALWVHGGLLQINQEKMSKSLQNMKYIKHMKNSFESDLFRYMILSHNYGSDMEINDSKTYQYGENMKKIRIFYFKYCLHIQESVDYKILAPLYNNLDSVTLLKYVFSYMDSGEADKVKLILGILGFKMENLCTLSEDLINEKIQERQKAKMEKNWTLSDQIRDFLLENFVYIEDKNNGSEWFLI